MNYLELLNIGIVLGVGATLGIVATYSTLKLIWVLYDNIWAKPRWRKKMAKVEADVEAIMNCERHSLGEPR